MISPHRGISSLQEYQDNGIYYHFFHSEDDSVFQYFSRFFLKRQKLHFPHNSAVITKIISQIRPDVIHLIGAENFYYSACVFDLPADVPLIVSLQTLLSTPEFRNNHPLSRDHFEQRVNLEKQILSRSDYIGTQVKYFREVILRDIKHDASFLDITLAVAEEVNLEYSEKNFDFVYFAVDISKAVDFAIEAFALAQKRCPELSLLIVGGYSDALKQQIDQEITESGLTNISFTGKLNTHNDVITAIRKARHALLPLKIDQISGTVREAMANGLSVVSTVTPATPELNARRQSILLSEKSDFQAMADNMLKIHLDQTFAEELRQNAAITVAERYNNDMTSWLTAYKQVIDSFPKKQDCNG